MAADISGAAHIVGRNGTAIEGQSRISRPSAYLLEGRASIIAAPPQGEVVAYVGASYGYVYPAQYSYETTIQADLPRTDKDITGSASIAPRS